MQVNILAQEGYLEVSVEAMVLEFPFSVPRSPILGLMCEWGFVEQERRLKLSLLVLLWFLHSVGQRRFGLGTLLEICVIDLHLTLPSGRM